MFNAIVSLISSLLQRQIYSIFLRQAKQRNKQTKNKQPTKQTKEMRKNDNYSSSVSSVIKFLLFGL